MEITLQYDGGLADQHIIDLYDAARALMGFQRSLALVTHFVLNGEVITQATSLSGAKIVTQPPEDGSWKTVAVILGGIFTVGSVGKDSPVGQIVTSVYDYVLYETMGFHVDYDKTLQQQYAEYLAAHNINQEKVASLCEKVEPSIADMHRPIVASKTATRAAIFGQTDLRNQIGPDMSPLTYDYLKEDIWTNMPEDFVGAISSYNMNTFKGRIYVIDEGRPIPFELSDDSRTGRNVAHITGSLRLNAADPDDGRALLRLKGFRVSSRTGRLKRIVVTEIGPHVSVSRSGGAVA